MERATLTTAAVEEWRPVKGFDGLYDVSSLSRVRSVPRFIHGVWKGTEYDRLVGGKIISQSIGDGGYYRVRLFINHSESKTMLVHRLVAQAFIPNPDNLPEVNHKDECKTNNALDNLEWCDKKYNINYGTGKYRSMDSRSKQVEQLSLDGQHVAFFPSIRAAARAVNGNFSHVQKAVYENHRISYGYRWRLVNN